jgi:hypothetical protein
MTAGDGGDAAGGFDPPHAAAAMHPATALSCVTNETLMCFLGVGYENL